MARPRASRSLAATLYACSFLSGIAALGYEVAWTKSLSLTFGATRLAAGAVLAAFLGGMGVGARAYPLLLARLGRPLRTYALLELGIAATSLALTLLLPILPEAFASMASAAGEGGGLVALRFVFALLLLLVPCALMGATFPALSVVLIRTPGAVGRHLGLLYGLNTLGAAVGALLAGLVLVDVLGLRGTVLCGNALNLAVAAVVLARAREARDGTGAPDADHAALPTRLPRALTGAVLAGSGLATLAYEILWFRALAYLFGNSTYAFTVMLFVFLAGLGLGPLLFRPIARRPHPERALALCQLGVALLATAAIGAAAAAVGSDDAGQRVSIFFRTFYDRPWQQRLLVDLAVAVATMLPATLLMGLSFPLATSLFLGDVRRLGERLGDAVLLANAGSIVGALGGALLLLPALGTVGGTHAVAVVNAALGLVVLLGAPAGVPGRRAAAILAVAAVLVGLALPDRMRFGVAGARVEDAELVFEEEGDLATVQVWRDRARPAALGMAIDGTTIGAAREWDATLWAKQVLVAHVPFALDARVRDVLTVGLGSGVTLDAILAHAGVRRADVVEINAPVVPAARLFPEGRALDDPRADLAVDDALHFLRRTPRRWDAIVSDGKQAMSFSGTSRLLSLEYYALCRERLAEGGIFVQWVPAAIGSGEFRMIVRTLAAAFPHLGLLFEPPSHLVLVASARPLAGRPRPADADFAAGRAGRDLADLGVAGVDALLARWVAGGAALAAAVGPGPANTWDRPRLEFTAYRLSPSRWSAETAEILRILEGASRAAESSAESLEFARGPTAAAMAALRSALAERAAGHSDRASVLALRALAAAPGDPAIRAWAQRLAGIAAGESPD
jgi:spermidine synthase